MSIIRRSLGIFIAPIMLPDAADAMCAETGARSEDNPAARYMGAGDRAA
ncbi:hypothetical protein GGR91_000547 [Sphingorhabdus rigui]|uniref:Uncharacterized protein n=1 Tax=Sphingorhabdus rigui TaxID=1282858 RepID=A0A840B221_9SPHN|nr:hypothetical protein [Sphingorhabdus rigui]MBB3942325.1 hypothetical protein [Sphingorhabdus rigui]